MSKIEVQPVLIAPQDRMAQMMRVMAVCEELGLSVAEALQVLRAFYVDPADLLPTGVLEIPE